MRNFINIRGKDLRTDGIIVKEGMTKEVDAVLELNRVVPYVTG